MDALFSDEKKSPNKNSNNSGFQLMDSTLRDGEQTAGVSFTPKEKESVAHALYDLGIRRIEMATACASADDYTAVRNTVRSFEENHSSNPVECLSFVLKSHIDWLADAGARTANLLVKSSEAHVTQLKDKTPSDHIRDTLEITDYAISRGLTVNAYLEHFSYGALHSKDYVTTLIDTLKKEKINRIMLCDTMGLFSPKTAEQAVKAFTSQYKKNNFDIHCHNDYGLATANTLAAIEAGCTGAHVTVNGLGERAGNAPLETVAASLKDFLKISTIDEDKLLRLSRLVETFSGMKSESNHPIIGTNSHVHKAGVHTHGAEKGLYTNPLLEHNRFKKHVSYDLGKLAGKTTIVAELEKSGITNPDQAIVDELVKEVKSISENKETITPNDLLLLYLKKTTNGLKGYKLKEVELEKSLSNRMTKSRATVTLERENITFTGTAEGDGGFDAIARAIRKITNTSLKLKDYEVGIPAGDGTSSLVDTKITWETGDKTTLKTRGIHTDQDIAATEAMVRAINQLEMLKGFRPAGNSDSQDIKS